MVVQYAAATTCTGSSSSAMARIRQSRSCRSTTLPPRQRQPAQTSGSALQDLPRTKTGGERAGHRLTTATCRNGVMFPIIDQSRRRKADHRGVCAHPRRAWSRSWKLPRRRATGRRIRRSRPATSSPISRNGIRRTSAWRAEDAGNDRAGIRTIRPSRNGLKLEADARREPVQVWPCRAALTPTRVLRRRRRITSSASIPASSRRHIGGNIP